MIDCGDTNSCLVPIWLQYAILLLGLVLFAVKIFSKHDPYDRR